MFALYVERINYDCNIWLNLLYHTMLVRKEGIFVRKFFNFIQEFKFFYVFYGSCNSVD